MGPDRIHLSSRLLLLHMAATIIASQALISGAFLLTMQGIQPGYIPRMEIRQTSYDERGQIYTPKINAMLGLGCAAFVIGFGTSSSLASAHRHCRDPHDAIDHDHLHFCVPSAFGTGVRQAPTLSA